MGYCGPIFKDSTFEYIPIPEWSPNPLDPITYANCPSRNTSYGKSLADFLDTDVAPYDNEDNPLNLDTEGPVIRARNLHVHFDPEFTTNTFGDYWMADKGRLSPEILNSFQMGNEVYLIFYAGLSPYSEQVYGNNRPINSLKSYQRLKKNAYLIGYFRIAEILDTAEKGKQGIPDSFRNNAHYKRQEEDKTPVIIRGDDTSKLLRKAIPLNEWDNQSRKYIPTSVGKKIGIKPVTGLRIMKWLNDEETSLLIKAMESD